jgi:hypothetical protein
MEKLKQEINYLISKRNSLWATGVLTIGSTASLLLRLNEGLMVHLLLIAGIFLSIMLIKGCMIQEELIEKLIKNLKG